MRDPVKGSERYARATEAEESEREGTIAVMRQPPFKGRRES